MSRLSKAPAVRTCPFCGIVSDVNHESQEGCIAALQAEIDRMREILASVKPTAVPAAPEPQDNVPATIRLRFD